MREAFEKVIDPDPARPPLLPLSPAVGDFGSQHAGPSVVVMGTDARHRSALARARMDNDVFCWEESPGYAPQVHAAMQPHAAFKTAALLAAYCGQSPGFVRRVAYFSPAVPLLWRPRLAQL
jgi:hypothetical protein